MMMSTALFDLTVYETTTDWEPKFKIKLPAVPRIGETITLPDAHYVVKEVFWQANVIEPPGKGYEWPYSVYYTIRLVVEKKFND